MTNSTTEETSYETAIAVIGMAGRFPGARSVEAFWRNIAAGVRSIRSFSDEELLAAGVRAELLHNPNYVKAGTVVEDIDRFDAQFFGYSPREAEVIDPQHRIFLECAWEALEHAAYGPERYQGLIGMFAGAGTSTYGLVNVRSRPDVLQQVGALQVSMNNEVDSLASTVSYKLNLRGPSVAVQSFCSSSLVAVHMACQSLLTYECDIALGGGVLLFIPQITGYTYQEGGIVSPDGHCRTFDAKAQGSVMGSGMGIVVLKRMEDALDDGDTIYAVIRGSAVNNDGIRKVGYTAPGLAGQTAVIVGALSSAGVKPETIGYIEAHGTATALGDSVELAAMIKAFEAGTQKKQFCALGSVKPNVGHLDRASGVTGLIKTVMALNHKQLPPQIDFESPNPEIDLANSPFYVNTQLTAWPAGASPRRAGVSSFGLGGTNAHVVLEEPPAPMPTSPARPYHLLLLSAKTAPALDAATANLAAHLRAQPQLPLAEVAYTLQAGRDVFNHRRALVARDRDEALALLDGCDSRRVFTTQQIYRNRPVAFLLPGVGDHYAGMAQELYASEPSFRATIERCCAILRPLLGQDLRALLYPDDRRPTTDDRRPAQDAGLGDLRVLLGRGGQGDRGAGPLQQTVLAQPAVFVVEYALAQLLMQWGVRPAALLGYSLGEYVAACLAGVLSLEDALRLIARRAQLIQELPAGAMLAVMLAAEQVQPFLSETIGLAALNSPSTCVLAGPPAAIDALAQQLAAREIACRRVETTHSFHTAMLAPVAEELTRLARTVTLHPPQIPYLSNVTGTWITDSQATDPAYWAQHMCRTVRFAEGVSALLQQSQQVLLEVGPGAALGSFVRQHPDCTRERMELVLPTLPGAQERASDRAGLLTTLGKLWLLDVPIDWAGFYDGERRQRVALPTYPFERQRYWVEPGEQVDADTSGSGILQDTLEKRDDLSDWFYVPSWKRTSPLQALSVSKLPEQRHCWLIFTDACGLSTRLAAQLAELNQEIVTVSIGTAFARLCPGAYAVRPGMRDDYATLLRDLSGKSRLPDRVAHLWMVTSHSEEQAGDPSELLERGFYSLLALTQALGDQGVEFCRINVISNNMQEITAAEELCPAKAAVIGPCKVIPQEYPNLAARSIDIVLPSGDTAMAALVQQLVGELAGETNEIITALRGPHRWVQTFEPVRIAEAGGPTPRLRERGVYMITGGLGGIGLAIAEYLANTRQARLALLGRSALPPREQWPRVVAEQGIAEGVGRRIHLVQSLEACGAEVLLLHADVADPAQVRAAVTQTLAHFGTINGVIHAAGVPGVGIMQLKTREAAAGVLAPKVQGTLALADALRAVPLDFLMLFSSVTSATGGGPGQADYCAANAFMDAYARRHAAEYGTTVAISWGEWLWDAWGEGLQGFPEEVRAYMVAMRDKYGITFAEGMEALRRIITCDLPHIFVSSRDLARMVESSENDSAAVQFEKLQQQRKSQPRYPRPLLGNLYVEPRNDLEVQIAAIWSESLGLEQIGVDDSFFELGGNSLLGIDLIARMRRALKTDALPTHVLYEAPTVSALAEYLRQDEQVAVPADDRDADDQEDKRKGKIDRFKRMAQMEDL